MIESEMLKNYKAEAERRRLAKLNHAELIVKAENDLTDFSNDFIQFLSENKELIIGKKLFIQTGKSAVFNSFLNRFNRSYEGTQIFSHYMEGKWFKIRACVTSGSHDDNTDSCTYIDRHISACFEVDKNNVCTAVRENPVEYKKYSIEAVLEAKDKIRNYQSEIEVLKQKISAEEKVIPQQLTGNMYLY
jgi:hypothetical protein